METKLARDVMTEKTACCKADTSLDRVAKMMVEHDCGQIPVTDAHEHVIGVITDRDIVVRVVAEGKNPASCAAGSAMSDNVLTARADTPLSDVLNSMEKRQVRRVPVVDQAGCCIGMIAQADIASDGRAQDVAELVREVSRDTDRPRA